jgi:predicted RNA-binding Zn-ribbon protein involved in translation (DUF1610 family)
MWKRLSLEAPKMPPTAIVECTKCHGLLLAAKTQKTHTCPYCGTQIKLQKVKRIAVAENAFEASQMLRTLKAEKRKNARKPKQK